MFGTARRVWMLVAVLFPLLVAGPATAQQHSLPGAAAIPFAPIGASLDSNAPAAGGGREITIGSNCLTNQAGCSARHFPYAGLPVQLVVLNRADLSTVTSEGLTPDSTGANTAAAMATMYDNGTYLMVLASLPGTATSSAYAQAIKVITGSPHANSFAQTGGWAAAGVPASSPPPGQVTGVLDPGFLADPGHPYGDLRGYFQRFQLTPTNSQYSFVSGRYQSFDTTTTGSGPRTDVMRIGTARYTLRLPHPSQCTGGYAIVVLAAGNLVPLSENAYATNCRGSGQDITGWQGVNSRLATAASIKGSLVFVQSIGNPANPGCLCGSTFGYASGSALETLGASAETWNRSLSAGGYLNGTGNSGYAMVGSPAIAADALAGSRAESYAPEAVSALIGHAARLQGLLRSDYNWNYLPVTGADAATRLGPTVATLEYGASAPWPTGNTPGQLKVLKYISDGAKGTGANFSRLRYNPGSSCYKPIVPDVRFEFCDTVPKWSSIGSLGLLQRVPAACGCTQADWTAVTSDLSEEISLRGKVVKYLNKLNQVFGSGLTCSKALVKLQDISSAIETKLSVPNQTLLTGGRWISLLSDTFNVASSILYTLFPEGSALANVLNNISATGYLGGDGVAFGSADAGAEANTLAAQVSATAAQLGPALEKTYCNSQYGFGRAEAILLSNYGKLHAAGSNAGFQISTSTFNSITPELQIGAERFIYAHLLGSIYHPYALAESNLDGPVFHHVRRTPATYACNIFRTAFYPWKKTPRVNWLTLSAHDPPFPETNTKAIGIVLSAPIRYSFSHAASYALTPPASIMNTITSPITSGGLGESKLDLFLHNFSRYGILCTNGSHISGPQKTFGPLSLSWP